MKLIIKAIFLLSLLLLLTPYDYLAATPCQADKNYQAFDFWLGTWEVKNNQGIVQGKNSITKSADGCLIHEHWSSVAGNKGYSSNYYNPVTKLWAQRWISAGSVIEYTGGLNDSGEMKLEGMIYYQQNATQAKFRGTWSPLEDGRVRQFFEQYDTEKATWTVWFEGFYTKIDSKE